MKTKTKPLIDFKGLADWVHVFSAGEHVASNGQALSFTQSDLDEMVETHDPAHPANHVITHKELFSPFGYGRALEYKREGNHLFVRSENIEPQFSELVEEGRLSERSIRLQKTDDGKWSVGHIAWLGSEPPAVKGLSPVEFNGTKEGVFDFSFSAEAENETGWALRSVARLYRGLRDYFIEKEGVEKADELLPDYAINDLTRAGDELLRDDNPQFSNTDHRTAVVDSPTKTSDPDKGGTPVSTVSQSEHDTAVQAERDKTIAAEARVKELEDAGKRAEFSAHVETLTCDPAAKEGMVDFMMALDRGSVFEFSATDGSKNKVDPVGWFKGFSARMPASVDNNEHDFGGAEVDLNDAGALAKAAVEFQAAEAKAGRDITVSAAMNHVTAGGNS